MIRHTKLMFACLAILALASTSCAKLMARDNLNKGVRAFREAKYEEAVNYFKQAVKLDPGYVDAEVYLGMAYLQQFIPNAESEESTKNADLAIETFNGILARQPNNVSAIAGLAYMYQNLVQLQKAREYYKKNAELAPTDPVPLYAVGSVDWLIVFDKNNPPPEAEQLVLVDEGLAFLDKAIAINPDYEEAMAYKNLLYREKARLTPDEAAKAQLITQADEWFNKALETRKKIQEAKKSVGGIVADSK